MARTYLQITKELEAKNFAPLYFIYGEEPFYIDELADYLAEHVLDDIEKQFNQIIIYGRDSDAATLVNYCKQFPMVGSRQLILLREGQDMDIKKEENLAFLLAYLKQPQPSTVLAICYKYKTPPAKLIKEFEKNQHAVVFESKRKYDSDLPVWISNQVNSKGYKISEKACSMILEFLGNDLEKINNELGKLFINHPKDKIISEETVEKYIGVSKDYNIFELLNAIAFRDVVKTNRIVIHFANNPKENSIFKTLPMLFTFFNKLLIAHSLPDKSEANISAKLKLNFFSKKEYIRALQIYNISKVVAIIGYIREANNKALGIDNYSTDNGELLRELVFKILH